MEQRVTALASDHAGVEVRRMLAGVARDLGYDLLDLGTEGPSPVDYPQQARAVAEAVLTGRAVCGVLICGTGIGMSMAANRMPGIRAALCHDTTTARLARFHNDANILCVGARILGSATLTDILTVFLQTAFEGGERHQRRIRQMG